MVEKASVEGKSQSAETIRKAEDQVLRTNLGQVFLFAASFCRKLRTIPEEQLSDVISKDLGQVMMIMGRGVLADRKRLGFQLPTQEPTDPEYISFDAIGLDPEEQSFLEDQIGIRQIETGPSTLDKLFSEAAPIYKKLGEIKDKDEQNKKIQTLFGLLIFRLAWRTRKAILKEARLKYEDLEKLDKPKEFRIRGSDVKIELETQGVVDFLTKYLGAEEVEPEISQEITSEAATDIQEDPRLFKPTGNLVEDLRRINDLTPEELVFEAKKRAGTFKEKLTIDGVDYPWFSDLKAQMMQELLSAPQA